MSIDTKVIMFIDTINVVYIEVKKKETYMKVIVSESIHIITASLSTTQLACWAAKGVGDNTDKGLFAAAQSICQRPPHIQECAVHSPHTLP